MAVIGIFFIVGGVAMFRFRNALIESNVRQRRKVMGRFLTEGMRGGDRIMFPVMALIFCVLGAAMIGWNVYAALTQH
ncbi:MAG: hypothetical protein ACR2MY_10475 [Candidatus Dormibacteria bacterium]